ncbi:alpha-L-fucosidase [Cytophagaceae bacterium YF14B1]|uniref:alpha-L-fucosidase n=1 Tax=Xanthocytophaga flava TaxID=3048013 RepID=A0AAE3U947_9BACT|nr:alpha-L-fucosidase [Xanthocytophaga flavus]MDJ1481863.1 alpha-L-fucosidase [Xanthocytophaga flavus]
MRILFFSAIAAFIFICCACTPKEPQSPPSGYGALPSPQQIEWQQMDMYAFVHFTINTFTNKEWGYGDEDPALFNPTEFNADSIVAAAKSAGLTGLILTCKHHDGFCLWPTKTTTHNISKSKWKDGKGDLVKEFSEACKRGGIRFGVYLSPWDRNNAKYGEPEYLEIYRAQMNELLTQYGPVFEIWHDGANGGDGYYGGSRKTIKIDRSTYYKWTETWGLEKKLQPQAVIMSDIGPDVRWVGTETGFSGDPCWETFTPESDKDSSEPAPGQVQYWKSLNGTRNGRYWLPAETNFSIRPGWFYHTSEDDKVKSSNELMNHYFASIGHGTTMLLNIPPTPNGLVHPTDQASLAGFGRLIKEMYAVNYAEGATITTSSVRGATKDYAPENVLDNNPFTYWGTEDTVTTGELTLTLKALSTFSVFRLRENIKLGQRIDDWAVDIWENNQWKEVGKGSAIGYCRLVRLTQPVTTQKVRVRITKSAASICLSDVALFKEPAPLAEAVGKSQKGIVDKKGWTTEVKLSAAIDKNDQTNVNLSMDEWKKIATQGLVVDMKKRVKISAFTYLPVRDNGYVDKFNFYTSQDGKRWDLQKAGEFSNIKANPISQRVDLEKPVSARYFRFEPLHVITSFNQKEAVGIAELGVIE